MPRGMHWRCPSWPTCHVSTCRLGWSLDSLPFQQHSTAGASPYRELVPEFQRDSLNPHRLPASRINKSLPNSSQHHLSTGFLDWGLFGSRKDQCSSPFEVGVGCKSQRWQKESHLKIIHALENHVQGSGGCAIFDSFILGRFFFHVIVVPSILLKVEWMGFFPTMFHELSIWAATITSIVVLRLSRWIYCVNFIFFSRNRLRVCNSGWVSCRINLQYG